MELIRATAELQIWLPAGGFGPNRLGATCRLFPGGTL